MTSASQAMTALQRRHPSLGVDELDDRIRISMASTELPEVAMTLTRDLLCEFATLAVAETPEGRLVARYFFYIPAESPDLPRGIVFELVTNVIDHRLPAISDRVHAADWHEREAEDMYGIHFEGHPFLGDFVLHDTEFPEDLRPMHRGFDGQRRVEQPGLGADWQPRRILDESGALVFPVGPVWGDYNETGLWLLETPGEQIRQAHTRLFFKYRAVEKAAEGQSIDHGLLLAERFSGCAAVAHALAYSRAVEQIAGCIVSERAKLLRIVFAEFERIRYHSASIAELAGSTGLAVAKAMAQEIEEALLRLAGDVCGHRYLFGVIAPGGLAWQPGVEALTRLERGVVAIQARINQLEDWLVATSSFLDRIEEMGVVTPELASVYGTVGPVGRASGRQLDLRQHLPYGGYEDLPFSPVCEVEGDGYARMRVFFEETRISARLLRTCLTNLPGGAVTAPCEASNGAAAGWVEAPAGGAFHWLELAEDGTIGRWHISTAGFRNWHAFHRSVEGAAFQDFPIVLASFGLSIAENDR